MCNKKYWLPVISCILILFAGRGVPALTPEPPLPPMNDQGEQWDCKAVSTASGIIHIQWRYEGTESPDSYRIYQAEGEKNPFSTEEAMQEAVPWQSCFPDQSCYYTDQNCCSGWNCFSRYIPSDEEEGKKLWFLIRAVMNDTQESVNLDAESVIVDLPWIDGLRDPNVMYFYVEDEKRCDSFSEQSQGCPFCSESSKIYFRLSRSLLAERGEHAWYYIDGDYDCSDYLQDVVHGFENEIYPTNVSYFGRDPNNEWTDIDDNHHIIMLFTSLGSTFAGYFNSSDKICGSLLEGDYIGNCADMFYISASSPFNDASLKGLKGTIAHEFQHMQHFEANAARGGIREELWLDEACAEYAKEVNNLLDDNDCICYWYMSRPNEISLTRFGMWDVHDRFGGCPIHWTQSEENELAIYRVLAHYDQGAIWAHYMEHNTSPITSLASLVEDPDTGLHSIRNHIGMDFQQAFINWTIANYTNPYADSNDIFYHYTAQFPEGSALFENQMVDPAHILSPELFKSSQQMQTLLWRENSVRDLAADYILLPHNGEENDHIHWEVCEINGGDNVCHLAVIDFTNPSNPSLYQVMNFPINGEASYPFFSEADKDISTCLIITNIAVNIVEDQADDYVSSYKYRAYFTRSPSIQEIKLIQQQNEMVLGGLPVRIGAGLLLVRLQFDQSMDINGSFAIYLDPQGEGEGEGAISIQPALTPWSQSEYPADTWTGSVMIPESDGENWVGTGKILISGVENFWQEPLESIQQFDIFIDTQIPDKITNPSVCFIDEVATIRWDRSMEEDILGYNLYGIPGEDNPLWVPLEGLSNPNIPSLSFTNPGTGVYQFTLTALDKAYNESVPSERFGLGIDIKIPLAAGLNIVGYPIRPPANYTSEELLSELGFTTKSLSHYLTESSVYQISYWEENMIRGSFPIIQDEAYIIYQKQAGCMNFTGSIEDREVVLYPGKNFLGIPLMSFGETFFDVFRRLKEMRENVESVSYHQPQAGKWTGTYDFFGKISGPYRNVDKGFGCLAYSR